MVEALDMSARRPCLHSPVVRMYCAMCNADLDEGLQLEDVVDESAVVKWVVNSLGELGVQVGGEYYFLSSGTSCVYRTGKDSEGQALHVRPVGKAEFGDTCNPLNMRDPRQYGSVSLEDSSDWKLLPSSMLPEAV